REPPAAQPAAGLAEQDSEQRCVIYIEDNLSNVKLVERVIKRRPNFKLLTAMQGRLGLDLVREHLPGLVLLDLDLPDIKGGEVLARMREHPRMQTIPVIVISADATPRQIDALMKSGAHAYITKPLNVAELLTAIDGAFCSAAS
ncbi:MAG: response regulator, partial [Verrucomicrobiota bacterium]|nr:response regulator [Verrucomicrobiota bacterium]